MAFRMLVVDLDGTTVPWDRPIAARDVAAARALADAGVALTIATGRIFSGALAAAETLGVRGSIASVNGSHRADVATRDVREAHYLGARTRAALREVLGDHALAPALLTAEHVHHTGASDEIEPYLARWSDRLVPHPGRLRAWDEPGVLAAIGFGTPAAVEAARDALEAAVSEALEVVTFMLWDSEHAAMKVRVGGSDKGTALLRLAEERGVHPSETVAVGDWHNDVPMLRAAGLSFAMAQAPPEIARHADEVLEADGREGGAIAEIAERVFGIRIGGVTRA